MRPRDYHVQFGPSVLAGQFILAADRSDIPEGWERASFDGAILGVHQSVPVIDTFAGDTRLGWIVGYPVDGNRLLGDGQRFECASSDPGEIEDALGELGGRWAALMPGAQSVWLDATGSMSVVYAPARRIVASTASLISYDESTDDRSDLIDAVGIPNSNGYYPFGLTARENIHRLLPGHRLDLHTGETTRFFPEAGPIGGEVSVADVAAATVEVIRSTFEAVSAVAPLRLQLTAGMDSRMLLACAREFLESSELVTFDITDRTSRVDSWIATRLARRFGLNHRLLPFVRTRVEDKNRWLFRTGACVGERRGLTAMGSWEVLTPDHVDVAGTGGEIVRNYWRAPDNRTVTARNLVELMGLPRHPAIMRAGDSWLTSIPQRRERDILDMIYWEMRLGCWAGLLPYGQVDNARFTVYPFSHRRLLSLAYRLPTAERESHAVALEVIRQEWPELLEVPFNRFTGWRHVVDRTRRAIFRSRQRFARRR